MDCDPRISRERASHEEEDRSPLPNLPFPTTTNGCFPAHIHDETSTNGCEQGDSSGDNNGYTLMVAGQRTGKTSFLRLLLDTCDISPNATKEQLASVAKFVQGCSGHTSHIRTASVDIELDLEGDGVPQRLNLSLVDTPSFDLQDESSSDRLVSEMLRHIESRLADGIENVSVFFFCLNV